MDQPSLKALAISPGKLSPGFSPGRQQYTVYVPHHMAAVSLIAEAGEPGMALQVNGVLATSGRPSSPVPLQVGRNALRVEPGGYEVRVIRAHPTPTWTRVQEHCAWSPRDSAGEVVFRDRMWIFGGYTPGLVADVWSSADGIEWRHDGEIPTQSGINIKRWGRWRWGSRCATRPGRRPASGTPCTCYRCPDTASRRYERGGTPFSSTARSSGGRAGRPAIIPVPMALACNTRRSSGRR